MRVDASDFGMDMTAPTLTLREALLVEDEFHLRAPRSRLRCRYLRSALRSSRRSRPVRNEPRRLRVGVAKRGAAALAERLQLGEQAARARHSGRRWASRSGSSCCVKLARRWRSRIAASRACEATGYWTQVPVRSTQSTAGLMRTRRGRSYGACARASLVDASLARRVRLRAGDRVDRRAATASSCSRGTVFEAAP